MSDSNYSSVVLLLHGNGTNGGTTITDTATTPKAFTAVGNAQTSTTVSKFKGSSLKFDGTGDSVTTADHADFDFGTGDFTIEFFGYALNQVENASGIVMGQASNLAASVASWVIYTDGTDIRFAASTSGGGTWTAGDVSTTGSGFVTNTAVWTHYAFVKSAGTLTIYINGAPQGSGALGTMPDSTIAFAVGNTTPGTSMGLSGYLAEVRITKGVARYTADFAPPMLPYSDALVENRLFCARGSNTAFVTSNNGSVWTKQTVTSRAWSAPAWNGTVFCAVASGSAVAITSPDGVTWTERTLPVSTLWNSVEWDGSVFIAQGGYGLATSPDGITWTNIAKTVGGNVDLWSAVAQNGSIYCAVPQSASVTADKCITRAFGSNAWTIRSLSSTGNWSGVAWNGTVFCAIKKGSTNCATSSDGITWTNRTMPASRAWSAIAWNGTVFCAVAGDSSFTYATCATSADGITWTDRTMPSTIGWQVIIWNGTVFCAAGYNSNVCATSADGITWTGGTFPAARCFYGMAWNGTVFSAVFTTAADGATADSYSSTDGLSWTLRTLPSTRKWRSISWNGTDFTALGESNGDFNFATSSDGITWTNQTSTTPIPYTAQVYASGDANTCSVGDLYYAGLSDDGITWGKSNLIVTDGIGQISANGIVLASKTANGTFVFSYDSGTTWFTGGYTATLYGRAAWDGTTFCRAQESSSFTQRALTSLDASAWTQSSTLPGSWAFTPAYGVIASDGARFVIFYGTNAGLEMFTSDNQGSTWTSRAVSDDISCAGVEWNGTVFCAVPGSGLKTLWSLDGVSWIVGTWPSGLSSSGYKVCAGMVTPYVSPPAAPKYYVVNFRTPKTTKLLNLSANNLMGT